MHYVWTSTTKVKKQLQRQIVPVSGSDHLQDMQFVQYTVQ